MRSHTADELLSSIRRLKTPYFIKLAGLSLRIDKNVYPSSQLNAFMAKTAFNSLKAQKDSLKVLDFGTGTGFLAITAALKGAKVIALDINPDAIKCAQFNVMNNKVEDKVECRLSNGFDKIDESERFDIITAGIPWENAHPRDKLEYSVYDPDFQMRQDLFQKAASHLKPNGRIILSYSQRVQLISPINHSHPGYDYDIIAKKNIVHERYFIYAITPKSS